MAPRRARAPRAAQEKVVSLQEETMSVKLKRTAAQSSTSTPQCKSSDDKRRQGAASSSTAAGKKRSGDVAGLDMR